MEINQLLSHELSVKPLPRGTSVTYKLITSDRVDKSRVDEKTGKPMPVMPKYRLAGRKTIYDPVKERSLIISNVNRFKPEYMPDGSMKQVPVIKGVVFDKGVFTVTSEQQDTYAFMERISENRDNPFRDRKVKPLFYRVNNEVSVRKKMDEDYLLADAVLWAKAMDLEEMKSINSKLPDSMKVNLNLPYEGVKTELFKIAKTNPVLFLKCSNDRTNKMKIQVMDAFNYQIILFSEGDSTNPRRWFFNDKDSEDICEVEPGTHYIDGLLDYFKTNEGSKIYTKLANKLKVFLKGN
jgi:hypothetical protein